MDVHVTISCPERMGIHEGMFRATFLNIYLNRGVQILHEHDFPVPKPIDQARHCILMEMIDAYPLYLIMLSLC